MNSLVEVSRVPKKMGFCMKYVIYNNDVAEPGLELRSRFALLDTKQIWAGVSCALKCNISWCVSNQASCVPFGTDN